MADILDPGGLPPHFSHHPAEELLCMMCGCGCGGDHEKDAPPPDDNCQDPSCRCHEAYWMTVPEAFKRELWGK